MGTIKLGSSSSASRAINYAEKRAVVKDGQNCDIDYAKSQFKQMRLLYDKDDGIQAHTIIQSFKPGEVTPEQANELGMELAKRVAPNHQVAVYTHDDKAHIHNHIIINSVDIETGKKFVNQKKTIYEVREKNDEICKERGLSIVEEKTAPIRYELAEKSLLEKGQSSWKDELRQCVDVVRQRSTTLEDLTDDLKQNFDVDVKLRGQTISYKHPDMKRWVRGSKLGFDYEKGGLEREFTRQLEKGTDKSSEQPTTGIGRVAEGNERTQRNHEVVHSSNDGQVHNREDVTGQGTNKHQSNERTNSSENAIDIGQARGTAAKLRQTISDDFTNWKTGHKSKQRADDRGTEKHSHNDGPKVQFNTDYLRQASERSRKTVEKTHNRNRETDRGLGR